MQKENYRLMFLFILTLVCIIPLSIAFQSALADWSAPTQEPPGGNVASPIFSNSTTDQTIQGGGDLGLVGNFSAVQASFLSNAYFATSGGSVGIGNTNPQGTLDVTGSICFSGDCKSSWSEVGGSGSVRGLNDSAGYYKVYVDDDGQIAMGGAFDALELVHIASNSDADMILQTSADAQQSGIHGYRSRGTGYSPSIVQNNDALFTMVGYGWNGSEYKDSPAIKFFVDGTPSATTMPSRIEFQTVAQGSNTEYTRMTIKNDGKVGIGTTDPAYALQVVGKVCADNTYCSSVPVASSTLIYAGSNDADLAEVFQKEEQEKIEPGDVVVLAGGEKYSLHKSNKPYDTKVAGIYSTDPGMLIRGRGGIAMSVGPQSLSEFDGDEMPLALAGQVPVKATNENGNIKKGDLLTTSSTEGHAMRCSMETAEEKLNCMGAILGKAMENCDQAECLIQAIVTLQ